MSRHGSLAEQLSAVMAYRNKPEGDHEPLQTNWTTMAANDNNPEDFSDKRIERRWSMRPSLDEIMEAVKDGETVRNDAGQIIAIGDLRFSDGKQTEKAHRRGIDGEVVMYDAKMPAGSMLGTRDKQERALGGDVASSNAAYTRIFGAMHPGKAKRKSKEARAAEKPAPERTKAEMRAELESAMAATDKQPTKCKAGFPWQPANLRDLFLGGEKGRTGESGSIAWEDVTTHIVEREAWIKTMGALSKEDASTLDAALTASSMKDLSGGKKGGAAYRSGMARLLASNDNLVAAINKGAA